MTRQTAPEGFAIVSEPSLRDVCPCRTMASVPTTYDIGTVISCSTCGRQYVLKDSQMDGRYWSALIEEICSGCQRPESHPWHSNPPAGNWSPNHHFRP